MLRILTECVSWCELQVTQEDVTLLFLVWKNQAVPVSLPLKWVSAVSVRKRGSVNRNLRTGASHKHKGH